MTLTSEQTTALDAPLDPKRISQRTDKGRALDYLETYDVIDAANRIFGYDGWGYEVRKLEEIASGTYWTKDNPPVEKPWKLFEATVEAWSMTHGCSRTDVGHGIARPADSVDTLEMQRKGAVSDALKRALRSFGNQFGNSLYDKDHAKPGRAGTQGGQGSAPRPLEPANPASKPQKDSIARMLHQLPEADAEEFCQEYDITIESRTDGRHYGKGIEAAGLTGGTHGTASQLIDALLPLVKQATKGKPAPRGAVEMADPREESAGVGRDFPKATSDTGGAPYPSPDKPRSKADADAMMGRISAMLPQFSLTVSDVCEWLQCQPTQVVAKATEWVRAKEGRTVTVLLQQIQADKGAVPAEPEQPALMEGE